MIGGIYYTSEIYIQNIKISQADFVLGELNRVSAEDERTFCPIVVAGAKSLPAGGMLTGNADLAAMLSRACNFEVAVAAAAGAQGGRRAAGLCYTVCVFGQVFVQNPHPKIN